MHIYVKKNQENEKKTVSISDERLHRYMAEILPTIQSINQSIILKKIYIHGAKANMTL